MRWAVIGGGLVFGALVYWLPDDFWSGPIYFWERALFFACLILFICVGLSLRGRIASSRSNND